MARTRSTGLARLASLIVVVVAAVIALRGVDLNPFGTETIDRSQPAVLKSIERLAEYHAATANLEVIVDIEEDVELLPSFIKGEKVLFVAGGTVDAVVSFERPQVTVKGGRAEIELPAVTLSEAQVDLGRSRVYDRDRGLFDRVESVFEDSPTSDQELIALAGEKLEAAAAADDALRRSAERNTRQMLEGLLTGLGFESVSVRFASRPAAA